MTLILMALSMAIGIVVGIVFSMSQYDKWEGRK